MGKPEKKPAKPELTDQQETFVEHYLQSWNATEAAKKAGYSPDTARSQASRLLTNVNVKKAIAERAKSLRMNTDEWYVRVAEQARSDMGDFLRDDGTIDLAAARKANKTRLLAEYQEETTIRPSEDGDPIVTTKKKIKLHSAQKALDMLGQRIAIPETKQAQLDAQVLQLQAQAALLENKLEELQKKEALLAFLQQKATPEVYQEVLRLLTGGPQSGGAKTVIDLAFEDTPRQEDPETPEAPPTSE